MPLHEMVHKVTNMHFQWDRFCTSSRCPAQGESWNEAMLCIIVNQAKDFKNIQELIRQELRPRKVNLCGRRFENNVPSDNFIFDSTLAK